MIFKFQTEIVKTRKRNRLLIFLGFLAGIILGVSVGMYLGDGIAFLEYLVETIGLLSYMNWFYLGLFALLGFFVLGGLRQLLKKKVVPNGALMIDQKMLRIVDGKNRFDIPEEKLETLEFDLKSLPKNSKNLSGGSYLHIPDKNGKYTFELNINSKEKKKELLDIIEYLEVAHQIDIKVKDGDRDY